MSIPEILKQIDAEIALLREARKILAGEARQPRTAKKPTLSADARERIAASQRRRWAAKRTPVVTVIPPVIPRTRVAQPKGVIAPTSALSSAVPAGPIAVRAADIPVRVLTPPPSPRRHLLDPANFSS
jgi:hypothetical protein